MKKNNLASLMEEVSLTKQKLRNKIDSRKSVKTSKLIEKINSRYIEILESEKEMIEVSLRLEKCLKEQREMSALFEEFDVAAISNTSNKKIPNTGSSRRFYSLQEIFSMPADYLELSDDSKISFENENELIKKIIINPEQINDDFLISIGLENEDFTTLPYHTKLDKKISHVKQIKDFFSNTVPLNIGQNAKEFTGRIMVSSKKGDHNYGNIVLIQNNESAGEDSELNKKVIIIHDNVYSFLRSQFHTLDSLSSKEKTLSKLIDKLGNCKFALTKSKNKTEAENVFAVIGSQNKILLKYRGYYTEKAHAELNKMSSDNIPASVKSIENATAFIERKIKKIISQRSSINKQVENIVRLTHSEEKNWVNLRKNFKELLRKLDSTKTSSLVKNYSKLKPDYKSLFNGVSSELLFSIKQEIGELLDINLDKEAKTEAYFWSKEDEKNNIDTSSKEYQDHQYFEALKQKNEYHNSIRREKITELETFEEMNKFMASKENAQIRKNIMKVLDIFLDGKKEFMAFPYSYIYANIFFEYRRLVVAENKNDPIEYFRALLAILITIKEYDALIFINRIEGNRDVMLIAKNEEVRQKYVHATTTKIQSLLRKDFLKDVDFSVDSATHKKFIKYAEILNKIKDYLEKGDYENLIKFIKELKLR